MPVTAELECLDGPEDCQGPVEYRMSMSPSGRSFPRCERHLDERLAEQERINRTYPVHPPAGWHPDDAGESWDEEPSPIPAAGWDELF